MTTYTLTATRDGETETFKNQTSAEVKSIKGNLGKSFTYKATKNVIVTMKQCYHNDTPVTYHEDRQNNWTLVSSADRPFYFAPTNEISFR